LKAPDVETVFTLGGHKTLRQLSQVALAKRVKSGQSRVAKMEAGDPSVSIDLLLRTLFALGATSREVASAISKSGATKAA